MQPSQIRRRDIVLQTLGLGTFSAMAGMPTVARVLASQVQQESLQITAQQVRDACWIATVQWTEDQCEEVAKALNRKLERLRSLRDEPPTEDVAMPLAFIPSFFIRSETQPREDRDPRTSPWQQGVELPTWTKMKDVLDWSIPQLALGLRRKLYSCEELTVFYFNRLKSSNERLNCVVRMNDRAIELSRLRDRELVEGMDRGILHGIPWGAKDIIAIDGMPTTWGVGRYEERQWNTTATVAQKLIDAGAVLLAKLSVGTLAWGDEWHRGKTRNPWNPDQGSSGSSAGSAAAVAARLCPFAIGSETLGSIVSPTRVCATSGLRPSFGRVSRAGCMTLSWTMDKMGPIANRAEDCGIVFRAILGSDGLDPTVVERPFRWSRDTKLSELRIGVPERTRDGETAVKDWLEAQGAQLIPIRFPVAPLSLMSEALGVEAASVHDKLFRSVEGDHELGKWGPTFREAQWVRAIDYMHAMRMRVKLIQSTEAELAKVDLLLGDGDLTRMNLTGHPTLVVAFGKDQEQKRPRTVALTAKMFSEATLLDVGALVQQAMPPVAIE